MLLFSLSAVTVSLAGLANSVQCALLRHGELFSQQDTGYTLMSTGITSYKIPHVEKGKWGIGSAVCVDKKWEARESGVFAEK